MRECRTNPTARTQPFTLSSRLHCLRARQQSACDAARRQWPKLTLCQNGTYSACAKMPSVREIRDQVWSDLAKRIRTGQCTPVIGAGACAGVLPSGGELAAHLMKQFAVPLQGHETELSRVAEYISLGEETDFGLLVDSIRALFSERGYPNFEEPAEPHGLLAELDLPLYITTNYDDFLSQALIRKGKKPVIDFPCWAQELRRKAPPKRQHTPSKEAPLVYHIHGHLSVPESMVLTDSHYLDFLIRLGQDKQLIPPFIQEKLASDTLLFLGYSIRDWNFRVLLRSIRSTFTTQNPRLSFAVQLPPDLKWTDEERQSAHHYLERFLQETCGLKKLTVCWSPIADFTRTLRAHWSAKSDPPAGPLEHATP
jgi:hypothetical protein